MKVLDDDRITVRTANILLRNGIENIEDLSNISSEDIMKWHNLGRKTLEEILQIMKKYNISFSDANAEINK